jgi:hypothetical protein
VTIGGDGQAQGCEYRTSAATGTKACDVEAQGVPAEAGDGGGAKDQYTRLTFERRFRPSGAGLAEDHLPSGDTLLGRQVLALAIGADGAVSGCRVVAKTGDMTPEYGCEEAAAEKFEAAARSGNAGAAREGYMSILVYGHSEHIV